MTVPCVLLNRHFSHVCLSQPPVFSLINTVDHNSSLGVLFTAGWLAAGPNDLSGNNSALAAWEAFGASVVEAIRSGLQFWLNYTEIRECAVRLDNRVPSSKCQNSKSPDEQTPSGGDSAPLPPSSTPGCVNSALSKDVLLINFSSLSQL